MWNVVIRIHNESSTGTSFGLSKKKSHVLDYQMASTLQIPIENSGFIEYALCSAVALGENMIGRYSAQKANVGILVALVLHIRP